MDKSSEEGKWLSKFYGLSFLPPEDVENSFIEDSMKKARCDDVMHSSFKINMNYSRF
jgi:hypothetical protein